MRAETAARLPYPALVRWLVRVLAMPRVRAAAPGAGAAWRRQPVRHAGLRCRGGDHQADHLHARPIAAPEHRRSRATWWCSTWIRARRLVLDGPTVTARRTAAVSLLAAQWLAPTTAGPLLIVGAGAGTGAPGGFRPGTGPAGCSWHSRSGECPRGGLSARGIGLQGAWWRSADAALAECPLVVTCTPAAQVVLRATPAARRCFIAAVGALRRG